MRVEIDTEENILKLVGAADPLKAVDLYSKEAFEILSDLWVKVGWNLNYSYTFSWMGRPVIQLPEDMIRMQEVIHAIKPDYIVETGVAHGGSLIFYASLFEAMHHGHVIGVDIEIRPHNRTAIEAHPLAKRITLLEGSSVASETVAKVKDLIPSGSKVLVILDSNHTRDHVAKELEAYHDLVSIDSYIVATDGIMQMMHDSPRGDASWEEDNPTQAAADFARNHPNFVVKQPSWPFNESGLSANVTHWPGAWLHRIR